MTRRIEARTAATLLVGAALVLTGCDGAATARQSAPAASTRAKPAILTAARPAAKPAPGATRVNWAAGGCPFPSDSPRAPIGKSADALVGSYGPTVRDIRFKLGEAYDPVRMTIRNVLSTPADLRREIREQVWERAGCELLVWSVVRNGTWTAVHTLRSEAGGEH